MPNLQLPAMGKRTHFCRYFSAIFLTLLFVIPGRAALYDIKKLSIRPAREYPAHQDFQNIVLGAYPCDTPEEAEELFDTDRLIEKNVLPILVVVENNNSFPIRISEREIYLLDRDGTQRPTIPFQEVLLHVTLKRPRSTYATRTEILLSQEVKKEMYLDFEHKAFGARLIAPHTSDYGVVFFALPQDGSLEGFRLYLPEVINLMEQEPLIFFEFGLKQ